MYTGVLDDRLPFILQYKTAEAMTLFHREHTSVDGVRSATRVKSPNIEIIARCRGEQSSSSSSRIDRCRPLTWHRLRLTNVDTRLTKAESKRPKKKKANRGSDVMYLRAHMHRKPEIAFSTHNGEPRYRANQYSQYQMVAANSQQQQASTTPSPDYTSEGRRGHNNGAQTVSTLTLTP